MNTLTEVMTPHGVEIPAHLVADAEVPVLTGMQRQGDVLVIPTRRGKVTGLEPIPPQGIAVVRGEAGGNTHLLVGGGKWAPITTDRAIMGTLVLEKEDQAFLLHPEHGATGIAGPGAFIVKRQREQADVVRLVSD